MWIVVRIFKTIDSSIHEIQEPQEGCWIALTNPTATEIFEISEQFQIEVDDLRAPLDEEERSRIEVDEELMRQMIAGQASLDSKVVRRIPDPEEEDTDSSEENTSETASGASVAVAEKTDVDTQTSGVKEPAGFRRKKLALPDFERTFFAPVDCRNRSAIYVSTRTKHKVSEILHLLGNESTRLTALVDNMLRFVMDIYRDELNYLHEKKNNRRPF